jgi:multiple sugar transport system permease protein
LLDTCPDQDLGRADGRGRVGRGSGQAAANRSFNAHQRRFIRFCIAPSMSLLVLVVFIPTLYLMTVSLTPLNFTRPETMWDFSDPLGNYRRLLGDERFANSLLVQAKLSIISISSQIVLGILLAMMLNSTDRFIQMLRPFYLVPMVLPPIVVAIIWKILYTPDISPIHWLSGAMGVDLPSLITDANTALMAIIIADTWQWFPFTTLMVLAALQMMPASHVEAAKIDGAGRFQVAWYVTLPYLRNVLLVAGLFRFIDSLKAFPLIYVLTRGGPGSVTEITNFYSFNQAFNYSYVGYSSAITVVMVTIACLLSWSAIRLLGERRHG